MIIALFRNLNEFIRYHQYLEKSIPLDITLFIIAGIARGLAYAHESLDDNGIPRDIVHRDVCPCNAMISTNGLPKLADFGIAIARDCSYKEKFPSS